MVVLIGCLIPSVATCINFLNSFVIDDKIVHRVTGRFVIFINYLFDRGDSSIYST